MSPANAGVCASVITSQVESTVFASEADFAPGDDYFAALRESFGPSDVDLQIGPLRFRLDGLSFGQSEELRRRFRRFVIDVGGAPDLIISLRQAGVTGFLRSPSPGQPEIYRLESATGTHGTALWSYEFA